MLDLNYGADSYIDNYVFQNFIEEGELIENKNGIEIFPSYEITVLTSKNNEFTYYRNGGASASWN